MISQESTVPLYRQLLSELERGISSGALKPGDLLPSEKQLCSQYGLSRSTVRQALNYLVEENLIIRQRGRGSFVAQRKLSRHLNHLYNFTEDIAGLGLKPGSAVLEHTVEEAHAEMAEKLGLPAGQGSVFKLVRLRMADSEPVLLETTYIPLYLCPDIAAQDFSSNSLYNYLRTNYNLKLFRATESYEAVKLSRKTAELLKCRASTCAFKVQRLAYLQSGTPFELTYSFQRGNLCRFEVELFAGQNRVKFKRGTNFGK